MQHTPEMNRARIGVIGVGWWGTVGHLEPLAGDPKTELVAVWSRTERKAQERAERYGVPHYYTDYRALIDDCELDGVIVASTPNMHYQQARYALEHGLHVLMEKPFVLQAAHANELQRLAQERGLLLSVCHPLLFYPPVVQARDQIREGVVGNILLITALFSQRVYDLYQGRVPDRFYAPPGRGDVPRPNATSYSDPAVVGGGEGHTQASHIVGALLWLTGLQPASVFARMNNLDTRVDVVNAMTVRFEGGALATVAANGLLPARVGSTQLQIQGDQGILGFDRRSGGVYLQTGEDPRPTTLDVPAGTSAAERVDGLAAVPKNYVRTILGEEELHVGTDVAINEARILDAAYRSAASGCEVDIER
jgi:predicted dehydrogenase